MITIKELELDDETALKLMRLIKENEPDIWKVFKPLVKQALNKHFVSNNEVAVCLLKRDYETCSFWEQNNCECIGCSNYKQTDC